MQDRILQQPHTDTQQLSLRCRTLLEPNRPIGPLLAGYHIRYIQAAEAAFHFKTDFVIPQSMIEATEDIV